MIVIHDQICIVLLIAFCMITNRIVNNIVSNLHVELQTNSIELESIVCNICKNAWIAQ